MVRKVKGGNDYSVLLIDYPIPSSGRHILTVRVLKSSKSYVWLGVTNFQNFQNEKRGYK